MYPPYQYQSRRFGADRLAGFLLAMCYAAVAAGTGCWPNAPQKKAGDFLDRVACTEKGPSAGAENRRRQRKALETCLKRKEARMIERYSQLVQRSGDRLLLKLKYGNTLVRTNTSDDNKELYDKLGKAFVSYYYYGFDAAHCYHVVAASYWQKLYLEFINVRTGRAARLPYKLRYSPNGTYIFGYDDDPSAAQNLVLYRVGDRELSLVYGKSVAGPENTVLDGRWQSEVLLQLVTVQNRLYALLSLDKGKWVLHLTADDPGSGVVVAQNSKPDKVAEPAAPKRRPRRVLAESYKRLGVVSEAQGRLDKALEYYHKALHIHLQDLGADHVSVARDYTDLGAVYEAMEKYDQALYYYHLALKIDRRQMGAQSLQVAVDYTNIGSAHEAREEYAKAINYYLKALKINLKSLGANHVTVADSYTNLGSAYEGREEYGQAIEYYRIALRIDRQAAAGDKLRLAADYDNLASAYEGLGNVDKAIEYYQHALQLKTAKLGMEHVDLAAAYNNLGRVYEVKQDYEKALGFYRKALLIAKQKLGLSHKSTKTLQQRVVRTQQKSRTAAAPNDSVAPRKTQP